MEYLLNMTYGEAESMRADREEEEEAESEK